MTADSELARTRDAAGSGKSKPRTSPDHDTTEWPPGIKYIIGNEGCERFSYYGMRSILVLYMAQALYTQHPVFAAAPERYARAHYHLFVAAVYALPLVGAIIADRLLGKYRTILGLSLVYCAGHAVLALFEGSVMGLWTGLGLIAVGSGGIKPCVSAHVGDQFGRSNWFRLRSVYQAFYWMINCGSFLATLLIPWIWVKYRAGLAFGIPGILMGLATLVFWMGRRVFVHVPPTPGGRIGLLDVASSGALVMSVGHLFFSSSAGVLLRVALSIGFIVVGLVLFSIRQRIRPDDGFLAVLMYSLQAWLRGGRGGGFFAAAEARFGQEAARGPAAVLRVISVFFLVSVFWALFDQHGSSWIIQADRMYLPTVFGTQLNAAQIPSLNPLLVMLLIPFMTLIVYPAFDRAGVRLTPLRRMTAGMLIASTSFVAVALIQREIDGRGPGLVHVAWQIIPYVLITVAEVLVSVTGLEFAYSQAPARMKSTIMSFWLLMVSVGNVLASFLSGLAALPLVHFFWLLAGLMALAAVLFGIRARFYVAKDQVQA